LRDDTFLIDDNASFIFEIDIVVEHLANTAEACFQQQKGKRVHSLRCQKIGKSQKVSIPILEAVKQYIEGHPQILGLTNNAIANNFVHDLTNAPITVTINNVEWDITYLESDKLVCADPDSDNKKLYRTATRSLSSLRKRYIPKAK